MPNLFYSRVERRPRALWRLLIQALIFFILLSAMQIVIFIAAEVLLQSLGGFDPTAATPSLARHPLMLIALAISSILAIWISFVIAARWLDRRPMRDYGFQFSSRWWRDLVFGLFLGAVLMALVFVVELAAGWVEITGYMAQAGPEGFVIWFLTAFIFYISVGIYEEMLFRGYHLRNMAEGFEGRSLNPRTALLLAYFLSSAIFGVAHAFNPNATLISVFNIAVAGLFLGIGYILTGDLAVPIGLHITWNFFQGNVFGFPVSGTSSGVTLIQVNQLGPDWMTGGLFGPEAGLIGLAAMLLGTLLTVLWVRYTRGVPRLREELAVYARYTPEEANLEP